MLGIGSENQLSVDSRAVLAFTVPVGGVLTQGPDLARPGLDRCDC